MIFLEFFSVWEPWFQDHKYVAFFHDKYSFKFCTIRSGWSGFDVNFPAIGWPDYFLHITKLIGLELLIDNVPASKFKRAAVGTLVFGAVGTIAGLVSGATARPKAKIHVAMQFDDLKVASYTTRCDNIGVAYRLINTLALMEKKYYEDNPKELKIIEERTDENNDSTDNIVYSEEIMKLKKMLDDGIIDEEEFKAFKKRLLDK